MINLLMCNFCRKLFTSDPMTIPCGWTVCSEHLSSQSIDCLICKSHKININDCVRANNIEISLLEFELKENLENLKNELKSFEESKSDPENYIFEYFSNLRRNVDIRKEELHQLINNHFSKLQTQIKENEEECKQNLQKSNILNDIKLEEYKMKIDSIDLSEDKHDITQIKKNLKNDLEIVKYINSELDYYSSSLIDYKKIKFEPRPIDLSCESLQIEKPLDNFNVISIQTDGSFMLWDINDKEFKEVKNIQTDQSHISCFSILTNERLVTGSNEGMIKVCLIKDGKCLRTFKTADSRIQCVKVLNRNQIITSSNDISIKIWNIFDGSCSRTLEGHTGAVYCLKVVPNNQLVSGSLDTTIKLWNLIDGRCVKTLKGHTDLVFCVENLKNSILASGSADSSIKIWDLSKGVCQRTLHGHASFVRCIKMSSTGLLVSGSGDLSIKVWDLNAGVCIGTLRGHEFSVNSLTILPNDKLISASDDKSIRLWSLNNKYCIKMMKVGQHAVYRLKAYHMS